MFSFLKITLANLLATIMLLSATPASAASVNILDRLTNAAKIMGYKELTGVTPQTRIAQILGLILSYFLGFLGVIFMILIIYAGLTWMTAEGNEQKVKLAKETLKNSATGLAVVVIAYAFVIAIGAIIKATGLFKAG